MHDNRPQRGQSQPELLEELYRLYGKRGMAPRQLTYLRKKYSWILVVGGARLVRRLIDIVGSAFLLTVLSPLFLVIAALIKLTDGGPVFYISPRVGMWGREFPFPKFRSMVTDADARKEELAALNQHGDGVTFKIKKDPRVTWIGRFMRKFSIDELPQLWCVLTGDMALVGPRPPVPSEVAQYTLADRRRLDTRPGLTCIWQVSGRADIPFEQQVELDVKYIESQSIWLDIKLLLKTIPAVLSGRGAY